MPVPCIILASLRLRKTPGCVLLAVMLVFVTNCGLAKGPEPAQAHSAGSARLPDASDAVHAGRQLDADRRFRRLSPSAVDLQREASAEAAAGLSGVGSGSRCGGRTCGACPRARTLARTSWRTHDHGQYLWNLGRRPLPVANSRYLSTFAPLVNLATGDTFRQRPFIRTDRRIGGVLSVSRCRSHDSRDDGSAAT